MTKRSRVYTALPVARDLRDPKDAAKLASKAPTNWVWLAWAERQKQRARA